MKINKTKRTTKRYLKALQEKNISKENGQIKIVIEKL